MTHHKHPILCTNDNENFTLNEEFISQHQEIIIFESAEELQFEERKE